MSRRERGGHGGGGHGGGGGERWLLTYADLITLLVAFFIVMFAASRADLDKFQAISVSLKKAFNPGAFDAGGIGSGFLDSGSTGGELLVPFTDLPPQQQDFLKISAAMTSFADDNGLAELIGVNTSNEGIVISLSGMLLFDSGSAYLRPEAARALLTIAEILRPMANKVRVEGHTDVIPPSDPAFPTNWELSSARAIAVLRQLADEGRVPADRLSMVGYGEFKPIADSDTRQGRAVNRRVDIAIIYTSLDDTNPFKEPTPTAPPRR
jgi:chemotaxis protein MotB